jgi:membrane protein implicated in regulation of membrane protease activity
MSKKLAGLLAAGGGVFAIVHFVGGGALVLPILLGAAAWQWAGGIGVGLLVAGGVLYFGVRRWRRRSAQEGKTT